MREENKLEQKPNIIHVVQNPTLRINLFLLHEDLQKKMGTDSIKPKNKNKYKMRNPKKDHEISVIYLL